MAKKQSIKKAKGNKPVLPASATKKAKGNKPVLPASATKNDVECGTCKGTGYANGEASIYRESCWACGGKGYHRKGGVK